MTVRTRFAPSPTGSLHVGGARTAVLNWLLARHHGGAFVLRVEDTDLERNVPGAEAEILDDLRWLGLDWNEGPDRGGPFGPYRQSERGEVYRAAAERLVAAGLAYACACPSGADAAGEPGRCACADRDGALIRGGVAALRFRVPDGEPVIVDDLVRGAVSFPRESVEDFVILRSDGRPTYNFAAAVDDAAMRITHVVRGSDHLVNTPKQLLLYAALGAEPPRFAHIPLILGPDRQKLSKRHGATSVAEHRREGYLPEALVNYLSLLSWSSPTGEEFLSLARLVEEVDLSRVGASDAVFDRDKLRWLSGRHLEALPLDELARRAEPFIGPERLPIPADRLPIALEAVRERVSLLSELPAELAPFRGAATDAQRRAREGALADPEMRRVLGAIAARLAELDDWAEDAIGAAIRAAGKDAGAKGRALFLPVRLALTGEEHGLDLAKVAAALGRERTVALLSGAGSREPEV